jgi:photosystem II stability/assembly factor-like uncharacterized protein
MALYLGTGDGVYRTPDATFEAVEQVLDPGDTVNRVRTFDGLDGPFAATERGLYSSTDGENWTDLDVPRESVVSVEAGPDGDHLYAGTRPAHLYVSTDAGESWRELEAFQDLPSRERWTDRAFREKGAQVRTLAVHPDAPGRVIAGIEPGGVIVSEDGGETWDERSRGVHDDVHHLLALSADSWLASTGNGFYRTHDTGGTWLRLDTDFREFSYNYYREAFVHDGTIFGASRIPGGDRRACRLFELRDDRIHPVHDIDGEFVASWGAFEETVLAGTIVEDPGHMNVEKPGHVLWRESDGSWSEVAEMPAGVKSMATF